MAIARQITLPRWMFILLALIGGCMHDRSASIPPDATLQTEGQKQLTFRASEPGTVYIYNRNDDKIVYSGDIGRGETIAVDPDKNRITLDGRTVLEKGLDHNETLRVFFKPNMISREGVVEEREIRTTDSPR
ncbi:MAG: hypothetical protein H7Z14_14935 [Anaerolineae bacterium]|nr:hypothetical protein [Phycisphaerae bacterium]